MFVIASICILLLVKIQLIANVETITAFRIDSFNDIVQNITHINSVLQEFIKNYRQLQDIYRSVELTPKDDVSDYVKRNKDTQFDDKVQAEDLIQTTRNPQSITQVFYSDEHHWKDTYDDDYYVNPNPMKKHETKHKSNLKKRQTISPVIPRTVQTSKKRPEPMTFGDESGEAKHQETNELHDSTDLDTQNNFNRHKTNRLIQETKEQRDVKKVIKYETFDKDMWNSITESKPIRYEYPKENLRRKSSENKKKTALLFITNLNSRNNKLQTIAKLKKMQRILKEDSKSIADSVTIPGLLMENAILRAKGKFGRACFLYVVRRCFLALNEASKKICKDLGCKKPFKKAYKDLAKESCQTEFHGHGQNDTTTKAPGRFGKVDETKSTPVDLTRRIFRRKKHHHDSLPSLGNNYLSTCYPHMLPDAKRRQLELEVLPETFLQAIATAVSPEHTQGKSILRDKYEQACKRESSRRCKKAGKKTAKGICEKYKSECTKKLKKDLRRLISKYCRDAFGVKKWLDAYEDDYSCSSEIEEEEEEEEDPFN